MDNCIGVLVANGLVHRVEFLDVHLFNVDTDRYEAQLFKSMTESGPDKASRSGNQHTHAVNVPEQKPGRNWNRGCFEAAILAARRGE